jgi:hypothetical protein
MRETTDPKSPPKDIRFPLAMGITIGVGFAVARAVESSLTPKIGYWGAMAVALVAVAGIGAVVALTVNRLMKK